MELLIDRNYYRLLTVEELLCSARHEPTAELAVVLAERLCDERTYYEERLGSEIHRAEEAEREADRLDDCLYEAQCRLTTLEERIRELEQK